MFFKTILLVSIFTFEALGLNNTFPSSEQKLADTGIPDQIEADGLYDPEILVLYNFTENEEEFFNWKLPNFLLKINLKRQIFKIDLNTWFLNIVIR